MMSNPHYSKGDDVFTAEGVAGKIMSEGFWDPQTEEFEYRIKWEDGVEDVQNESFLDIDGEVGYF